MRYTRIFAGVIIILAVGTILDIAFSMAVWKINNITDGPWWMGFLIFGFTYLCALPGLLVPYVIIARWQGRADSAGVVSALLLSLAYPASLLLYVWLLGGFDQVDRWVNSVAALMILFGSTLTIGIFLSYLAVLLESRLRANGRSL